MNALSPIPEIISGSIFIRKMGGDEGLETGAVIKGHKHNFDHTSIFFCGLWQVRRWTPDDVLAEEFQRSGPFHILIDRDCKHEFTFLGGTDRGIAWCVFSHRNAQGAVVEAFDGHHEAHL